MLEQLNKFFHETRVVQKEHEVSTEAKLKEKSLSTQELANQLLQVEIQMDAMVFEHRVLHEVEEKQKIAEGKGIRPSQGIYLGH